VTYPQAMVLGIVQGVTEFLPISSSGHLLLVPYVFGWPDQGLAVDAAVHLGTLAALLAYFRVELAALAVGAWSRRLTAEVRLAILVALATVPAGLAGWWLGHVVETFLRSPRVVAATTALWAVVMGVADRRAPVSPTVSDPLTRLSTRQAMTVGCAQALALIPGTSRSGITITAGLLTGLDRATAARFAFLLGIPITAAAGGLKAGELARAGLGPGELGPLLMAVLAAFLSGWAAVWFLVTYLKRRSLRPFVVYRLLLAAVILTVTLG
jgi:undecaprenyl-diphosphatase